MKRYRICIIGGGASGLAAARVFASEDYQYEPTIFEQNSFIGGQWNYDPDGTSESTAVYKNLKTNLPCSVMQFSDFPFPNNHPESYVSLKEMQEYLIAYSEKYQLSKYILLNTKVDSIDETFTVIYTIPIKSDGELPKRVNQNLIEKNDNYAVYSEQFDAICVANGHYSEVYIPGDIPGLNQSTFPIIHARSYREPEPYRDQCIIVVGGSHSGIDICGELASVAKQVILSIKEENIEHFHGVLNLLRQSGKQLCTDYSSTTFSMVSSIDYIDKDTVYFKNQTSVKPDLIIFATGYDYRMPFLQGKLQVDLNRLLKNRYVYPLYKQLFHANFPDGTLSFLTIPYRIVPFPLAEIQSHLIARVLSGKISLPSREEMIYEIDQSLVSPNRSFHCVDMIKYTENLFEIMNESNQYFNYKFVIDNQRRIRQVLK
jgi:thioredoxin reductase